MSRFGVGHEQKNIWDYILIYGEVEYSDKS